MTRFIVALVFVSWLASPTQGGWWHHGKHHAVQYAAPVYAVPAYSAPIYSAPMYAAPQYYAPAAPEDRLSAPIQDIMIELLRDVVRNRVERFGQKIRYREEEVGGGGVSGGSADSSLQQDVRDLKGEVKDLSLRMENANSILQTHGKKLVENEQALSTLTKKFEEGGEIYELFANARDNRTPRRSRNDEDDTYSRDDEEYRREEYRRRDSREDEDMDAPNDEGAYRRQR